MKKKVKIEYMSTFEAYDFIKKAGCEVTQVTLRRWFSDYNLGKKVAGRLYFNKKKIQEIIDGRLK
jgi:hypothetical protein